MSEETIARRPPRFTSFACVLYPEDALHEYTLQMMNRFPRLYKAVYILHDKDVYSDQDFEDFKSEHNGDTPNWNVGDRKKAHYHVLFSWGQSRDVASMSKFLGVYVQGISDKRSYLQYMIHATFDSRSKFQYPIESLEGDQKTISLLTAQNSHFVQLEEILEDMENGSMLTDIVRKINRSPNSKALYEVFEQYQYFICACSNQLDRRMSKVFTEKYFDSKSGEVFYK